MFIRTHRKIKDLSPKKQPPNSFLCILSEMSKIYTRMYMSLPTFTFMQLESIYAYSKHLAFFFPLNPISQIVILKRPETEPVSYSFPMVYLSQFSKTQFYTLQVYYYLCNQSPVDRKIVFNFMLLINNFSVDILSTVAQIYPQNTLLKVEILRVKGYIHLKFYVYC